MWTGVALLGALSQQAGDVFVIDARGETRCGTMGSILATRMCVRGVAGIVTDGCYRDSPELAACEQTALCWGRAVVRVTDSSTERFEPGSHSHGGAVVLLGPG